MRAGLFTVAALVLFSMVAVSIVKIAVHIFNPLLKALS